MSAAHKGKGGLVIKIKKPLGAWQNLHRVRPYNGSNSKRAISSVGNDLHLSQGRLFVCVIGYLPRLVQLDSKIKVAQKYVARGGM